MRIVFLIVLNLVVFIALPVSAAMYFRTPSSQRPKNRVTGGMGSALQELDRLLTRPSVEFRQEIDHERKIDEDDNAGE